MKKINKHSYLSRLKRSKCLIIGDIILDRYLSGDVSRISPEAPIPVVHIKSEKYVPGGAANVACNILGCRVNSILCGVIGDDENGRKISAVLRDKGIEFEGIISSDRMTTTKTRVTGMNQQIVRLDEEIDSPILPETEETLYAQVEKCMDSVNVVIISDYNKGVCTEWLCRKVIDLAKVKNKIVIVDPKAKDWTKYKDADIITPNFKEFSEAMHEDLENSEAAIGEHAPGLVSKYGLSGVLVTRSQYGMTYVDRHGKCFSYTTAAQEVFDVSGAGDTVVAVVAAFLAAGYKAETAIEASNYAAAISVSKLGTYTVDVDEIFGLWGNSAVNFDRKIVNRRELNKIIADWKRDNKKVVFTNGCFDILHTGHITYLKKAKQLGDKLIIGLNTDRSVRALKGELRPVNTQEDRALLLAALAFVDLIVLFDENTPYDLIKAIRPHILVKGGDYKPEKVVGREFAGEVVIIPFVEGHSTTNILEKLDNIGIA